MDNNSYDSELNEFYEKTKSQIESGSFSLPHFNKELSGLDERVRNLFLFKFRGPQKPISIFSGQTFDAILGFFLAT
jgi:hypothetical protein